MAAFDEVMERVADALQPDGEDPVSKFLEGVRAGYGAKFGPVFEGFGLELVDDLKEAPSEELAQVESRLAAAGAGPAHIRRMRQAIDALRGEEAAAVPPTAPATPGAPAPAAAPDARESPPVATSVAAEPAASTVEVVEGVPRATNPFADPDSPLPTPSSAVPTAAAGEGFEDELAQLVASSRQAQETSPASALEELHASILGALEIDSPTKIDDEGAGALAKLRRSLFHTFSLDGPLEREVEHAVGVLNFVIDMGKAKMHRIRIKHTCEVLNILMACPSWEAAFKASTQLQRRIREGLPTEAQVAFAQQHPAMDDVVDPEAHNRAHEEPPAPGVVADTRRSAREIEGLRRQQAAARKPPSGTAGHAAPDEWQECMTQADGMRAFVNKRTGEIRWEAPVRVEIAPGANPFDSEDDGVRRATSAATVSTVDQEDDNKLQTSASTPAVTHSSREAAVAQAAKVAEWAQAAWRATQDGGASSASADAGGRPTAGPAAKPTVERKWSPAELEAYGKVYRGLDDDPAKASSFLDRSGLPERTLSEIKRVGCLDIRKFVGPQNFYACCRLVAHCQALQYEDGGFELLRDAGSALQERLPGMLAVAPRQMPHFEAPRPS